MEMRSNIDGSNKNNNNTNTKREKEKHYRTQELTRTAEVREREREKHYIRSKPIDKWRQEHRRKHGRSARFKG